MTITMTAEQVAAFVWSDAWSWHSFYDANNLMPDGIASESHMHEMDATPAEIEQMVKDASASSFDPATGILTLVKDSMLAEDILHVLDMKTSNLERIITGPARCRCLTNIIKKLEKF